MIHLKFSYPEEGRLQLWLIRSKANIFACNSILIDPGIYILPQLKINGSSQIQEWGILVVACLGKHEKVVADMY